MSIEFNSYDDYKIFYSIEEFLKFTKENNFLLCIKDITIHQDKSIFIECYNDIYFSID